ncbi:MAG TPA: gephyrin-like molybdotransferase Glp [Candidatus Limnocylindrales bacterium]|nr:gephyrin-like molybdotransferase Glp [Candidatus Limnocylindrales bacterium]
MLSFEDARARVIEVIGAQPRTTRTEIIDISSDPARALGRVLAKDVLADRDYPPFNRSTRDGYAVRAADAAAGAKLRLIGESRAGIAFEGSVGKGECVRILTGAPVPSGADAVVMQEYARLEGDFVQFERATTAGQNFVAAGTEGKAGDKAIGRGTRLGYAELAVAAQVGRTKLRVNPRPRVAILSTGDEVVNVDAAPGPFQIRNSNSVSLAAQVALAGGEPVMLGNAADDVKEIRARIEKGLESDILVLSGGVSVGTYDLVEPVLGELGAEFFFDSVAIRPGKPAVFAKCRGKGVFGLPGNPVSTMVTFELFVAPAIEILSGAQAHDLALFKAKLAHGVEEKPPLAHFLPAEVHSNGGDPTVELIRWQGSGDVGAVARGNCFLLVRGERQKIAAGEWVDVLPRRGMF